MIDMKAYGILITVLLSVQSAVFDILRKKISCKNGGIVGINDGQSVGLILSRVAVYYNVIRSAVVDVVFDAVAIFTVADVVI